MSERDFRCAVPLWRATTALILVMLSVEAARVQSPAATPGDAAAAVTWRAAAGHESFAFRDIARHRPPVDASPVGWRGSGPTLTVDYNRTRPLRLHRFALSASSDGGFVYDTGLDVTSRPAGDSASFLAGHYDYHRYFARPVVSGLHAGIGVRGIGERRVLQHHYAGNIELTENDATGTLAVVGALRFRRSAWLGLEAEWTNGATLAHSSQRHVTGMAAVDPSWGAGWLTDIAARVELRVTARSAALFSYRHDAEGLLFNHRAYAAERRRLMVGVTYAP